MLRSLIAAVVLSTLFVVLIPAAAGASAPGGPAGESPYRDAVAQYLMGEVETAIDALLSLSDSEVVRESSRFGRERPPTTGEWRV